MSIPTGLPFSFSLFPPYGSEGNAITVSAPPQSAIDFTASSFDVYFVPDSPPPGAPAGGIAGLAFFGYKATFNVNDPKSLAISIPHVGTDPLKELVPGTYGLLATTNIGYLMFGSVIVVLPGAGMPRPAGAYFVDQHVPYIPGWPNPYSVYEVPYPWTYWYDAPGHPAGDPFWSDPQHWPAGSWKWAPLPPPPPGWHVTADPYHGWVLERTVPWGNPANPPAPPANWPPWTATPPLPTAPTITPLPPPAPNAPAPALVASAGATPPPAVAATASTVAPAGPKHSSGQEPIPEPKPEAIVRWLVEVFTPIRTGPGARQVSQGGSGKVFPAKPKLFNGKVPVERDGGSSPVRRFDVIVSAQLLDGNYRPVPDKYLDFSFNPGSDVAGDTSELLKASDDITPLCLELEAGDTTKADTYAKTNSDGKAFCRFQLDLLDEHSLQHAALRLKGIDVTISDSVPQPTVVALAAVPVTASTTPTGPLVFASSTPMTVSGATLTATTAAGGILSTLRDIFVEPLEHAVDVVAQKIDGELRAIGAGVRRTFQHAIGFALKRFADGIIDVYAPILRLVGGQLRESLRAMIIGVWLGIPRGIWAMGRDTLDMFKQVGMDLPRALYNFISDDPKFALEIFGTIIDHNTAQVAYRFDPDFRAKVDQALGKFVDLAKTLQELLPKLWSQASNLVNPTLIGGFVRKLAEHFYDGFKAMVGDIATDYLEFVEDKNEYCYFVYGFIIGDVLGYILATIGAHVITDLLTDGLAEIATVLQAVEWLKPGITLIQKIVQAFQEIKAAVGSVVKGALGLVKQGIMRVFLGVVELGYRLIAGAFEYVQALVETLLAKTKQLFLTIMKYLRNESSDLLRAVADGIKQALAAVADKQAMAGQVFDGLIALVDRKFVPSC